MVLSSGSVTGTVDGRTASKEEIGLMMTGVRREDAANG